MKLHNLLLAPLALSIGTVWADSADANKAATIDANVAAAHSQLLAMFPKFDASNPQNGGYNISDATPEKQVDGQYTVVFDTFTMKQEGVDVVSGPVKVAYVVTGDNVAIALSGTGKSTMVDATGKPFGTIEGPEAQLTGRYSGQLGFIDSLVYDLGDLKVTTIDNSATITIADATYGSTLTDGKWPLDMSTKAISIKTADAECSMQALTGDGLMQISTSAYKTIVDQLVASNRDPAATMDMSLNMLLIMDAMDLDIKLSKFDCKTPNGDVSADQFRFFSNYNEKSGKGDASFGLELLNAALPEAVLPAGLNPKRVNMNIGVRNVNPGFGKMLKKIVLMMQTDPAQAEKQSMGLLFGLMGSTIYVEDGEIATANSTITHHGTVEMGMQAQGSYHIHVVNIDALIADIEKVNGEKDDQVMMLKQLKTIGVENDGGLQYDFVFTPQGMTLNGKPFNP